MKHVERRHFFVRELVEDHKIRCPFVSTVDNLADFFTKPLNVAKFYAMRRKIMNEPDVPSVAGRATSASGGSCSPSTKGTTDPGGASEGATLSPLVTTDTVTSSASGATVTVE